MTVVLAVAICSCLCWVAVPSLVFGWPLCILGKCVVVGWLVGSTSAGQRVAERNKVGARRKFWERLQERPEGILFT